MIHMISKESLAVMQNDIHQNAVAHGWWDGGVASRNFNEILLLIVGEVSELHESFRLDTLLKPCDKKIGLTCLEEEGADIVIRLLDAMGAYGVEIRSDVYPWPKDADTALGEICFEIVETITDIRRHRNEWDKYAEKVIGLTMTLLWQYRRDLIHAIDVKHEYNKTRPYRHGGMKA
jgi:hypothetical protein